MTSTEAHRAAADRQLWRIKLEAAKLDAEQLIAKKFAEARDPNLLAKGDEPRRSNQRPKEPINRGTLGIAVGALTSALACAAIWLIVP